MFVCTLEISIQVSLNIFCDVYAHNKLINLVYFSFFFGNDTPSKQLIFNLRLQNILFGPRFIIFYYAQKIKLDRLLCWKDFFHKWQQTSGKYKCLKVKHIPRENSVSQCLDTYFTLSKQYNLLDRWSEFKCLKLSKTFNNLILSLHMQQAT